MYVNASEPVPQENALVFYTAYSVTEHDIWADRYDPVRTIAALRRFATHESSVYSNGINLLPVNVNGELLKANAVQRLAVRDVVYLAGCEGQRRPPTDDDPAPMVYGGLIVANQ